MIQSPAEGYEESGRFFDDARGPSRNLPPASAIENMALVSPAQGLNGFNGVNPTYLSTPFNTSQAFSERQRPPLNKHPSSSAAGSSALLSSINGPLPNGGQGHNVMNGMGSTTLPQPFGTNNSFIIEGDPSNDWFMDASYGWQKNYTG